MVYSDEFVCGLYYLSLVKADQADTIRKLVKEVIPDMEDQCKAWYQYELDYFATYGSFTPFDIIKSTFNIDNDFNLSISEAYDVFIGQVDRWKSDSLLQRMLNLPLRDREPLLNSLSRVLVKDDLKEIEVESVNASVDEFMIKPGEQNDFQFPMRSLTSQCIVKPGTVISVISGPAVGKTTFGLSTSYHNSIRNSKNTLYIYGEDMVKNYRANLYALHSHYTGNYVENASIKQGLMEEDVDGISALKSLIDSFDKAKQGNIFFCPMFKLSPEPVQMGNQLSKLIKQHKIDIVVFDYLQLLSNMRGTRKYTTSEWLDLHMENLRQVCLGQAYENSPVVGMFLVQMGREAEKQAQNKRNDSKGGPSLYSGAYTTQIEKSSMIVIGLHSTPASRSANQAWWRLLKNRDKPASIANENCSFMGQYSLFGDATLEDGSSVYTTDNLSLLGPSPDLEV